MCSIDMSDKQKSFEKHREQAPEKKPSELNWEPGHSFNSRCFIVIGPFVKSEIDTQSTSLRGWDEFYL